MISAPQLRWPTGAEVYAEIAKGFGSYKPVVGQPDLGQSGGHLAATAPTASAHSLAAGGTKGLT